MNNTIRTTITHAKASGGRKGWVKHVTRVDTLKRNGYAFEGKFLNEGQHDLPEGAVLVHYVPGGSMKHAAASGYVCVVTPSGLAQICKEYDWRGEFLSIRDAAVTGLMRQCPVPGNTEPLNTSPIRNDADTANDYDATEQIAKGHRWNLRVLPMKTFNVFVVHATFQSDVFSKTYPAQALTFELRVRPTDHAFDKVSSPHALFVRGEKWDSFMKVVDTDAEADGKTLVTFAQISTFLDIDVRAIYNAALRVWQNLNLVACIHN